MEMELNRAFDSTLAIMANVKPGQLDAPTPCASWDVSALINHVVGNARWWASLLTGDGHDVTDYAAGDFVAAYREGIQLALTAFSAEGALEKMARLPFGEFPGAVVRDMAATEQFAHGWDLARAIGWQDDLDPELAAALLSKARHSIGDSFRGPEGEALFGPVTDAPAGAGPADQLAAYLGRTV